jgi:hypothetical protein
MSSIHTKSPTDQNSLMIKRYHPPPCPHKVLLGTVCLQPLFISIQNSIATIPGFQICHSTTTGATTSQKQLYFDHREQQSDYPTTE